MFITTHYQLGQILDILKMTIDCHQGANSYDRNNLVFSFSFFLANWFIPISRNLVL
jgi:hypothetical protein